ncbi:helix-turn-helix domain-containing protein [Rhodococcus jostii]|uniref:helix-turn-helix domain-containing protein n=1 Tax=Rhodococcus jostii TaxID=132919 RepID=UPI0036397ACE
MEIEAGYILFQAFLSAKKMLARLGCPARTVMAIGDSFTLYDCSAYALLSPEDLRECELHAKMSPGAEDAIARVHTVRGRSLRIKSTQLTVQGSPIGLIAEIQADTDSGAREYSSARIRNLSRLERMEELEIRRALHEFDGNKLRAAYSLGISRSSLYRKMNAYGLS